MGDLFAVVTTTVEASSAASLLPDLGDGASRLLACGNAHAVAAWQPDETVQYVRDGSAWLVVAGYPRIDRKVCAEAAALLDLYRHEGRDFVRRLKGHFLLLASDGEPQGFLAANDKSGVCTFYWTEFDGGLAVSSRLAPLRHLPGVACELSSDALYNYLYFTRIPAPMTIFSGIAKAEPASRIVWNDGRPAIERYWVPDYSATRSGNKQDAAGLRTLLDETAGRIVAQSGDSSVGAFLSGGLDSSTLCVLLHRHLGRRLQMFNISFKEKAFDESIYARAVAETIDAPYHEIKMEVADLSPILDRLASSYEEPYGNSSAAAALFAAEQARARGIEVMIGGDGGDELFGGNERYVQQKIFEAWRRLPARLREALAATIRWPDLPENRLLRKARGYIRRAEVPLPARLETYNLFEETPPDAILANGPLRHLDPARSPHRVMCGHFQRAGGDWIDRMMYLDLQTTIADDDLRKVQVTCASEGITSRFPFLEDEIVAFANAIPGRRHVPRLALRDFFRSAMTPLLPTSTLQKSKKGFGLPFPHWLRHEPALHGMVREAITRLSERNLFNQNFLDELLAGFDSDKGAHYAEPVWLLIMLEKWYESHLDRANSGAKKASLEWIGPS